MTFARRTATGVIGITWHPTRIRRLLKLALATSVPTDPGSLPRTIPGDAFSQAISSRMQMESEECGRCEAYPDGTLLVGWRVDS